jgi:hypothetical protein
MVENFLPYVKDRTTSLLRNKVFLKYIEKDVDVQYDWKETRLLLCYLLLPSEDTNHMEYLYYYINGLWEDIQDYLVIRIVPKEKEHKVSPRGFGCKTVFDRARGIIQELNVARFLHDYSDEQAMTLGELPLIKKLNAFRNLREAYIGYKGGNGARRRRRAESDRKVFKCLYFDINVYFVINMYILTCHIYFCKLCT